MNQMDTLEQMNTKEAIAPKPRRFAKAIYQNPELVSDKPPATQTRMLMDAKAYMRFETYVDYMCECKTLAMGCSICLGTHIVPVPAGEMRGIVDEVSS